MNQKESATESQESKERLIKGVKAFAAISFGAISTGAKWVRENGLPMPFIVGQVGPSLSEKEKQEIDEKGWMGVAAETAKKAYKSLTKAENAGLIAVDDAGKVDLNFEGVDWDTLLGLK